MRNLCVILLVSLLADTHLKIIRGGCIALYCGQATSQTIKDSLDHIDGMLVDFSITNSQADISLATFTNACKALKGDLNQVGPKMDAFRAAGLDLEARKNAMNNYSKALQTSPESDIFRNTSLQATTEFNQPNCMYEINSSTIGLLRQAERLLQASVIDCGR
jgi:hypothetical protein